MRLERHVSNGRLACPLAGDVDVERCFGCNWCEQVKLTGPQPQVICRPKVPDEQMLSHKGVRLPLPL